MLTLSEIEEYNTNTPDGLVSVTQNYSTSLKASLM